MAITNPYFNNTEEYCEQNLINELVVETIQIHGIPVYYLPRTLMNPDYLMLEDPTSKFDAQFMIEMYVKTYGGFEGQGDIVTKFNLELRDEMVLVVSRERFVDEIGSNIGATRPHEGDIIYFPPGKDFFEIKFVEHESMFYQLGKLFVWELRCEKLEYSSERITTGMPEIDEDFASANYDIMSQTILASNGNVLTASDGTPILYSPNLLTTREPLSQNVIIQEEAEILFDFSQPNPYLARP